MSFRKINQNTAFRTLLYVLYSEDNFVLTCDFCLPIKEWGGPLIEDLRNRLN